MKLSFEDKATRGKFTVFLREPSLKGLGILNDRQETNNTIVYNTEEDQSVTIDQVPYLFPSESVLPLVANQHFVFEHPDKLIAWQFNREFYCIADHDAEVSCVGFLFFGIEHPLFVKLSAEDAKSISIIQNLCIDDMDTKDRMQGEMLRTLLKRLIINVTRIAKKQTESCVHLPDSKMDLVRMFNLLLEGNFRKEHEVRFYARALNKAPKTLANLFAIFNYPSPLRLIQNRIILEAKRHLHYTDLSAKEIAFYLGFASPAHFSRFFKQHSGENTSLFRQKQANGV